MRKLYRIASEKFIRDLSGAGAAKYGGRWNPKGTYVLYTAANPSLAMLEWLAHTRDRNMDEVYCMATILVPEGAFKTLDISLLPENWRNNPGAAALLTFGTNLVTNEQYLGFEVPSVLMPLDYNIILNTQHPLFTKITIEEITVLEPDTRLLK